MYKHIVQSPGLAGVAGGVQAAGGGGPATYATWNSADKGANITLSNGDLTCTTNSTRNAVRSTIGKSSGKWYWEVTYDVTTGANIGVGTSAMALTNYPGAGTTSYGYFADSPNNGIYNNGAVVDAAAAYVITDIIGIALDMSGLTVDFYKNNVIQGSIAIAAGTWYAAAGDGYPTGGQVTANFGATSLTYTPPAGYNAGLYS